MHVDNNKHQIMHYLTKDNRHKINQLIKGIITQTMIAEKFKTSKTNVRNILLDVEPEFDKKYTDFYVQGFETVLNLLKQGVTIDIIDEYGYLDHLIIANHHDDKLRPQVLAKMRHYGLLNDVNIKSLVSKQSLKSMITAALIEFHYNQDLSVHAISKKVDVANTTVRKALRYKKDLGTPLPESSNDLYHIIKRNIKIYNTYHTVQSFDKTYDMFKDEVESKDLIKLIVATIDKYNVKDDIYEYC